MTNPKSFLSGVDFSSCLRPKATQLLAKKLLDDRLSLNLVGKDGIGKQRMLFDLQELSIPNVKWVYVNVKEYSNSYQGFVKEVTRQLHPEKEDVLALSLGRALTMDSHPSTLSRICVLLDNFGAILNNPDVDRGFNQAFIDALNSAKNQAGFSLLCVTPVRHNTMMVYRDGKPHRNSDLDLNFIMVDPLKRKEIIEAFREELPPPLLSQIDKSNQRWEILISAVSKSMHEYSLIQYLSQKLALLDKDDPPQSLKMWLRQWKKEYYKTTNDGLLKKSQRAGRYTRSWFSSFGFKLKLPIIKSIIAAITRRDNT